MAISLEELAAVALEGTVGPVTLAVRAIALAVALATGARRPLRRIAAMSVFAANRTRQSNVRGWVGAFDAPDADEEHRVRDQRGRFVRRATPNGSRPA
jgi:hypothetical protein